MTTRAVSIALGVSQLTSAKQQRYTELVASRKRCSLCTGLTNPSCRKLRHFDSKEIGPWSLLYGNLDAKLMIVGQDWGDVGYFTINQGRDDLKTPTNRNLIEILTKSGLRQLLSDSPKNLPKMFWTNAILCLKTGGLQAKVEQEWFDNCSSTFLKRQIEIVKPKIVVGLGAKAFEACLNAFDLARVKLSHAVSDKEGTTLLPGVRLFAAYHCGARTLAINRSFKQQVADWMRIAAFAARSR